MQHFKPTILMLLIASQIALSAKAQEESDSVFSEIDKYDPELGYFQKAYSDIGDPRFMFTDGSGNLDIGIGGTIKASAFFDFYGTMGDTNARFSASNITIPSDKANKFGMSASGSELHIKARSKLAGHKIIAFIGMAANDDGTMKLGNAYVSFDGFTIGRVYSFFMDLEAGGKTVDMKGPNTEISIGQPLLGYTRPLGKRWTLAASLEMPQINAGEFSDWGVEPDNQSMPDIVAKAKYDWGKGHVQVAGLLRNLSYWRHARGVVSVSEGDTRHCTGWGVSLSGRVEPSLKSYISYQAYHGKGIARYINDLGNMDLDMTAADWNPSTGLCTSMDPVPVTGGFIAGGYNWSSRLSSNITLGYVYVHHPDELSFEETNRFKCSGYGAINLFYAVDRYCQVGLEYVSGFRRNYQLDVESDYGEANRINASFIYQF